MTSEEKLEWDLIDGVWMSYDVDPMQIVEEQFYVIGECPNMSNILHMYKMSKEDLILLYRDVRDKERYYKERYMKYLKKFDKYEQERNSLLSKIKHSKSSKKYKEKWAEFPENKKYECSTNGRIRNLKTKNIVKQRKDQNGRYIVSLLVANKNTKNWLVHRAIAITFIENKYDENQVNHIDGNCTNNEAYNLEWCDGKYNSQHAHNIGLQPKAWGNSKRILETNLKTKEILEYQSIKEINLKRGFHHTKIIDCAKRKITSYKGYKYEYVGETIDNNKKFIILKKYPGYRIYEDGTIYSEIAKKIMSQSGVVYKRVGLRLKQNGKTIKKSKAVHVLVALAFVKNENPKKYKLVDHIDNNTLNNYYTNLKWTDYVGNRNNPGTVTKFGVKVNQYALDGKFIKTHDTLKKAEIVTGAPYTSIIKVCKGQQVTAGGFKWVYTDEDTNKKLEKYKKSKKKNKSKRKNKIKDEIKQRPDNIE